MRKNTAVKIVVILVLLLTWAPITGALQVISYLGPLLVAVFAIFIGVATINLFDLLFYLIFFIMGLAGAAFYNDTGLIHPLLGLLTYSSLLFLILRFRLTEDVLPTFINSIAVISILEGILGSGQLIMKFGGLSFKDMSSGDFVVGTLGTNSPVFAMKMLFQGLLLLYAWSYGRKKTGTGLHIFIILAGIFWAFFSAVLASAMMATIIFLSTVLIYYLWSSVIRLKLSKKLALLLGMTLLLGVIFVQIQPKNVTMITDWTRDFLARNYSNLARFQKFIAFDESIREVLLDNPKNLFLGLGLGRYSSRAAMMLSGGYLRVQPSWLPVSRSKETETYIYSRWNQNTWALFGGSILAMPTSSIQSILIEFGLLGTALICFYFWSIMKRSQLKHPREGNQLKKIFLTISPIFIFCLFTLSFADVWLEYPQLTFFIYLVITIGLSNNENNTREGHGQNEDSNPLYISQR